MVYIIDILFCFGSISRALQQSLQSLETSCKIQVCKFKVLNSGLQKIRNSYVLNDLDDLGIEGRHPSGVPYRIQVDAPALEIDVTSLMWIDGRRLFDHIKYYKEDGKPCCREKTKKSPETLLAPEKRDRPQIKGKAPDATLKLVAKYLPTAPHQTDANHWALSGDLLAQGIKLSVVEALAVGRHYYDLSEPNYRNGQPREAYAREFQHRHSLRLALVTEL